MSNSLIVLLSVYNRTSCHDLSRSLDSLSCQTLDCFDLAINMDGPVTTDILSLLDTCSLGPNRNIFISSTVVNKGLASSLNSMILRFFDRYEFFARQDCDDYSHPSRLERQLDFMNDNMNIDILGTGFYSFSAISGELLSSSILPINHEAIFFKFAYYFTTYFYFLLNISNQICTVRSCC